MRSVCRLLCVKARLELADDRPDLALATMRCNMALAKHTAETTTLISHLVGIAIAMRGARTLEQVIAHPKTPNLYWSLASLPQPFIDPRKALEGERLGAYATFPGILDVANNLDAGPLPPEQIEKMVKMYFLIEGDAGNGGDNPVRRLVLTQLIRGKHAVAKKALIEAGRPADKVEQWPHVQVAIMHALMEYDQLWDEYIKWQGVPYYKAAPSLEKYEKRVRASRQRGPTTPPSGWYRSCCRRPKRQACPGSGSSASWSPCAGLKPSDSTPPSTTASCRPTWVRSRDWSCRSVR